MRVLYLHHDLGELTRFARAVRPHCEVLLANGPERALEILLSLPDIDVVAVAPSQRLPGRGLEILEAVADLAPDAVRLVILDPQLAPHRLNELAPPTRVLEPRALEEWLVAHSTSAPVH